MPLNESFKNDMPLNILALKKSNELMAYSYSSLYDLKTTGVGFLLFMGHGIDLIWR